MKQVFIAILILTSCQKEEAIGTSSLKYSGDSSQKTYVFGVHPLHNPNRLYEVFGPITRLINRKLKGKSFRLEASRDYADFDKKMATGAFDISLPNPYQTLLSLSQGYKDFGKMADDDHFRGILVVRKDSSIKAVKDLIGKPFAFLLQLLSPHP